MRLTFSRSNLVLKTIVVLACSILNVKSFSPGAQSTLSRSSPSVKDASPTELQRKAAQIASAFEPDRFDPLITDCHAQTILGFLLRGSTAAYLPQDNPLPHLISGIASSVQQANNNNNNNQDKFWDMRERVETPDGDWFHADTKFVSKNAETAPTVLLCHGLESSSESILSQEMATAYNHAGMNCVCVNFRACTGPNDTLGAYHLGFTDDLRHYLAIMKQQRPHSRIYLSGFSLGANVILKCLGELGQDALHEYNIHGAAALCAPLDQVSNAPALAREGINRWVYSNSLLRSLKRQARWQFDKFCSGDENTDKFDWQKVINAKTITEFDDGYIAPIYGFDSCWDYYQKTSSIHFLEDITVPTLILNAADDPFFDPNVWPLEKSFEYGGKSPVKMVRTDIGGHLGFCFHKVDPDDERLINKTPSWASMEASRFLIHIESHPETASLKL